MMRRCALAGAHRFTAIVVLLSSVACGSEKGVEPSVPTTLTANSGTSLGGVAGSAVSPSPSVVVKDQNDAPMSGVPVTFAVSSGGGSLTGESATTDVAGLATVGSWTLGAEPGPNSLTASASGLATVTFTADAAHPQCAARATHSIGATSPGVLSASDCPLSDNTFADFFSTSLAQTDAYVFRQSAGFDAYLFLAASDGGVIAENDDESASSTNSEIKALLPAGSYILGASSFDPAVTGDYTISSSTTSTAVTGCELVYVVKNVSTTQNLEDLDCVRSTSPAPPIYADSYFIFLRAGQSITVTMTSTAVDAFLELVQLDGDRVASNDNRDATTKDARMSYTAATNSYYAIFARTAVSAQTGSYTLTIQ